ncbi:hypothetical protein IAQ61_004142 [Plenodomus lingam]|uniref:uncharacterized protein n=1 Tax=Leptosphaeria maculans TaxID=5022 RepID=UPI0033290E7D|nr:hypothetical protein IAQ61_004142 [Plenodomus lingam]
MEVSDPKTPRRQQAQPSAADSSPRHLKRIVCYNKFQETIHKEHNQHKSSQEWVVDEPTSPPVTTPFNATIVAPRPAQRNQSWLVQLEDPKGDD